MTLFKAEELHPAADRLRHAQTLAAIYQGASIRRTRKAWSAADFLPPDPWAPAPARRTLQRARSSEAARMAALVARFRR